MSNRLDCFDELVFREDWTIAGELEFKQIVVR